MIIITCLLLGIFIKLSAKKNIKRNVSFIRMTILNFVLSLLCYSYYIGYSVNDLKAAFFKITPNTLYFTVMSIIIAVCTYIIIVCKEKVNYRSIFNISVEPKERRLLILIGILAFVIRIIGIDWGDGVTFHADEGNLVRPPIYMAENNTLLSDETLYPTQITSKVLSIIFKTWMLIGNVLKLKITDLSYVCIARTYIAILSVGVVISIFFIGNYLKKNAGIVAAALAAVFPPFVQAAHCVTGDTFVALCICLSILCAFRYMEENRELLWLSCMSLLAVFATLDKYHGMIVCGIIAIAICIKQIRRGSYAKIISQGCYAIVVILFAAVMIVPNLFMNADEVIKSLLHLTNDYEEGATFLNNVYTYIVWFFSHAGILCVVPILVGTVCLIKEKKVEANLLGIGFIEIFIICLQNRHYMRWGYPFYIVLLTLTGIGVIYLKEMICRKGLSKVLFYIGITLIGLNGLAGSVLVDTVYANSQLDTRSISEKWCLENGIKQEDCIYDRYTCWSPGGMVSRYRWNFYMSIKESIEKENNDIFVNHLGRKWAVANLSGEDNGILDQNGVNKVAYFESGCHMDDASYNNFSRISVKIFEPYSIFWCFDKSFNIMQGNILHGNNIAIYDISMLPAYEVFSYIDYDSKEDVYWSKMDSISSGKYVVEINGQEINQGTMILEDENGETISICRIEKGFAQFSLKEQYYHVKIKMDNEFESIKIIRLQN